MDSGSVDLNKGEAIVLKTKDSLHQKEHFVYYGNIKENVQVRIDAYLAAQ